MYEGFTKAIKAVWTTMAPAFLFWRSYVEYQPDKFYWWLMLTTGFFISVKTITIIQNEP